MGQSSALTPAPTVTEKKRSHVPRWLRITGRGIEGIFAVVGALASIVGLLQFVGVTHVFVLTHFIHPSAYEILAQAKAAPYNGLSCVVRGRQTLPLQDLFGTCYYTSNPERSEFVLRATGTGVSGGLVPGIVIFDKGAEQEYLRYGSGPWEVHSTQCPYGVACTRTELDGLDSLFDLQGVRFVGAEIVDNQPTYHIAGIYPDPQHAMLSSTEDLWIEQDTNLPVRSTLRETQASHGAVESTFLTQDFNPADLDVAIPLPVIYPAWTYLPVAAAQVGGGVPIAFTLPPHGIVTATLLSSPNMLVLVGVDNLTSAAYRGFFTGSTAGQVWLVETFMPVGPRSTAYWALLYRKQDDFFGDCQTRGVRCSVSFNYYKPVNPGTRPGLVVPLTASTETA